jgi:hypothetical protein
MDFDRGGGDCKIKPFRQPIYFNLSTVLFRAQWLPAKQKIFYAFAL